jgi:hypothetical protein
MFLVSLGSSSMCLEVPFIAPRQLGVVGGQQGRLSLPSVGWRTGQSGAPLDSPVLISFLFWRRRPLPLRARWRTRHCPVHTGQSGAPLPTVGAGHASPADCAADRCAGDRWLTGHSGAPPDSPVNYSRTPPIFPESGLFTGGWPGAPDTVGAPPDTVR